MKAHDAATSGDMAAHLQLGDVGAAFDELRQLSAPVGHRLRATFTGVVSRLVQELVLDERIEDAVLACQQALAAEPDSTAPIAELMLHLHEVLGTGAARSLETALNFDVSQVELQLQAAELYLHTDDYGKAIQHLRRALTAHPDDTRVLATLGSAYNLKGDDRQAEAYLNQALALEPEN